MLGFPMNKWGLTVDPKGAQVRFDYGGRVYLGDVVGAYHDAVTGTFRLKVRHFCGDMWPFDPPVRSVEVLELVATVDANGTVIYESNRYLQED